jgi:hypothetical protein
MGEKEVYKRGRDWLTDETVNSFIAWEINYLEGEHGFCYASVSIADCNRRIELSISNLSDLGKLDVIREHLDRFERAYRAARKKVGNG